MPRPVRRLTFEELEPAAARDVGGRVVVDLFVAAAGAARRRRGSRRSIGGACCLRLVGFCPRGADPAAHSSFGRGGEREGGRGNGGGRLMIWKKGRGRGLERRGQRRRFGNGAAQELLEVLFVGGREREEDEN